MIHGGGFALSELGISQPEHMLRDEQAPGPMLRWATNLPMLSAFSRCLSHSEAHVLRSYGCDSRYSRYLLDIIHRHMRHEPVVVVDGLP